MLLVRQPTRVLLTMQSVMVKVTVIDVAGDPLSRRVLVFKNSDPTTAIVDILSDPVTGIAETTTPGNANDLFTVLILGTSGEDVFAQGGYTGTVI